MEILLYIILGIIVIAVAVVLLKLAAALLGLALVLGGVTWLFFDSFWLGAIIGGVITLVMILKDPGEYFDSFVNDSAGSGSGSSTSRGKSERYIHTSDGEDVKIYSETSDGFEDVYGHRWRRGFNGDYTRVD